MKAAEKLETFTLQELTKETKLNERYVKEWLGCITCAHIFTYNSITKTYTFPQENSIALSSPSGGAWLGVMRLATLCGKNMEK